MALKMPIFHIRKGTMDDAFTQGYILHHPNPDEVDGVVLQEEFIADAAQEVEECESDQKQRRTYPLIGAAAGLAIGLPLALLLHVYPLLLVPSLVLGVFGYFHAQGQNRADEIMGHTISYVVAIDFEGMTPARAIECFVGNLGSYPSCAGLSSAELEKRVLANVPRAREWVAAHPEVITALQAMKAQYA